MHPSGGEAAREFLSRKPTVVAVERERYVTGDTILFIVDWTITSNDHLSAMRSRIWRTSQSALVSHCRAPWSSVSPQRLGDFKVPSSATLHGH